MHVSLKLRLLIETADGTREITDLPDMERAIEEAKRIRASLLTLGKAVTQPANPPVAHDGAGTASKPVPKPDAIKEFLERNGAQGVTVRSLAEHFGVAITKRSIYNHLSQNFSKARYRYEQDHEGGWTTETKTEGSATYQVWSFK